MVLLMVKASEKNLESQLFKVPILHTVPEMDDDDDDFWKSILNFFFLGKQT